MEPKLYAVFVIILLKQHQLAKLLNELEDKYQAGLLQAK